MPGAITNDEWGFHAGPAEQPARRPGDAAGGEGEARLGGCYACVAVTPFFTVSAGAAFTAAPLSTPFVLGFAAACGFAFAAPRGRFRRSLLRLPPTCPYSGESLPKIASTPASTRSFRTLSSAS